MNLAELRTRLTVTVPEAGEALSIGRDAAYRAAASGQIPTLRLGRRIVVPTAKLLALLGVEDDHAIEPIPVHPLRAVPLDGDDSPAA